MTQKNENEESDEEDEDDMHRSEWRKTPCRKTKRMTC